MRRADHSRRGVQPNVVCLPEFNLETSTIGALGLSSQDKKYWRYMKLTEHIHNEGDNIQLNRTIYEM